MSWQRFWKTVELAWQDAERTKLTAGEGLKSKFPGPLHHFSEVRVLTARKQAVFQPFRRLQNPRKLARKFEARSGLTVRMHLRRSSASPAHLPMRTHPRSLRPRARHQPSSVPVIQYKVLTKLWSRRRCCRKGSSHSSGISAQQRGQPASELRGSGQGRRRCKLVRLLGRGQECKRTPRTHRSQSSFRCCTRGAQAPKKARSRLAQMVFNTATARQDAENAERLKWIACLSQLAAGTAAPLGQRLVQRPAEVASMGLGLRAGTLRNRAHVLRRYFLWLAQSFRLPFPEQEEHYLDFLALRVQEPCTRCTLKGVHQPFVYLEEVSEIEP